MIEVYLGSLVLIGIVLGLVAMVLAARAVLMPSGAVAIKVNGGQSIAARRGDKLLEALSEGGISLPSSCGGAGTCGQCRVHLSEGRVPALPTEAALLSRRDIAEGTRLACQVTLRGDIGVRLPESLLSAREYACAVISSRTVAPMIREMVLALPEGEDFTFTPGAFVQVVAPPYTRAYADYTIAPEHQAAWESMGVSALTSASAAPVSRAYSIATSAADGAGRIVLLIRLALPPPGSPGVPPGVVSSWLFGLAPGQTVNLSGPFGSFAAEESHREMVFIGGGVGMAPLRAIISDQLERKHSTRKMSFWYGARAQVDLFYGAEFDRLAAKHPNFHWVAALSDPASGTDWQGETGFIHSVVLRRHLADHPAPHACEYYLCGPPLMIRAVLAMLDDVGVDPAQIHNDDFGG